MLMLFLNVVSVVSFVANVIMVYTTPALVTSRLSVFLRLCDAVCMLVCASLLSANSPCGVPIGLIGTDCM